MYPNNLGFIHSISALNLLANGVIMHISEIQ